MSDIWAMPVAELDLQLATFPSVVTWSRLEPLSLSSDLSPGLQALLADPLWMIGRQWQFAELRGEDGGTPISSIAEIEHAPLSRFHPGALTENPPANVVDLIDEAEPLEARVEAEGVPAPAARIRAEAGLQLLRMLTAAGLGAARNNVVAQWRFGDPATVDPDLPDRTGSARGHVYSGRVPDARLVEADIGPLDDGTGGPLTALPAGLTVPGGAAARLKARGVLADWLRWYRGYLVNSASPTAAPASWISHRLEYAFAVQAELPSGRTVLRSDEYTSGRVDWTDFDATEGDLGATPADRGGTSTRQVRLPTPATFPGMPADRLWAFEDARVYLGGIEAGPTDLARMALVEFSLTFGVDWFVLPVEVPAGSVIRVESLTVLDTFGFAVEVKSARQPGGWSMFGLTASTDTSSRADVFVVPPVVTHVLESDPLEEVALFRDEMANLVWGVERVVQGASGEPVNRSRAAPATSLRQEVPVDLDDAAIVYRLMTPVPDHWVPFVAVPVGAGPPGAVELERRPLVHFRNSTDIDVTHPRGTLLRTTPESDVDHDRLRIAEEEVPRDGAIVTRRYQMARTPEGKTVLWIGRRKRTGQGEGWSGLRFDTALPPGAL
jgi:hypothetical protein